MFRSVAAPGRAADPAPGRFGSGVEREGRSGFYFACSARYLAALAWASESPCLPAVRRLGLLREVLRRLDHPHVPSLLLLVGGLHGHGLGLGDRLVRRLDERRAAERERVPDGEPCRNEPYESNRQHLHRVPPLRGVGPADMTGHGEQMASARRRFPGPWNNSPWAARRSMKIGATSRRRRRGFRTTRTRTPSRASISTSASVPGICVT